MSAEDLKRYTQQLDLMRVVCDEFDQERDDDSPDVKKERFQRILVTMQKMQQCGSPPTDLLGDVPDFNTSFGPGMTIPGMTPDGAFGGPQINPQCAIM